MRWFTRGSGRRELRAIALFVDGRTSTRTTTHARTGGGDDARRLCARYELRAATVRVRDRGSVVRGRDESGPGVTPLPYRQTINEIYTTQYSTGSAGRDTATLPPISPPSRFQTEGRRYATTLVLFSSSLAQRSIDGLHATLISFTTSFTAILCTFTICNMQPAVVISDCNTGVFGNCFK